MISYALSIVSTDPFRTYSGDYLLSGYINTYARLVLK